MSIRCGNPKHGGLDIRHESVADVRACYASPNGVADFAPTTEGVKFPQGTALHEEIEAEVWPWAAGAAEKLKSGHATSPIFRAPKADLENAPGASSCAGRNFVEATEAQTGFIRRLLGERDWEIRMDNDPIARRVSDGKEVSRSEASSLITALKALPKRESAEPKPHAEQPWRKLSREVPAGYYAVTDAERKNHFYRVSVGKKGFFKVQEQASDELYFVPLSHYADILQSILDFGLEAAGKFYATEKSACYRCNRTLTDNIGNPYFELGLGPECGAK